MFANVSQAIYNVNIFLIISKAIKGEIYGNEKYIGFNGRNAGAGSSE